MIFNKLNEDTTEVDNNDAIDTLIGAENPDNIEAMADEVEAHMTAAALEAVTYFEGGQEAVDKFEEALEMEGENGYVRDVHILLVLFLLKHIKIRFGQNLLLIELKKENLEMLSIRNMAIKLIWLQRNLSLFI